MQRKIVILFQILILMFIANISAQTPQNFGWSLKPHSKKKISKKNNLTNDDTIKVETNLVINDIFVLNKDGFAIKGLKPEDFIITEDDASQKLEIFSLGSDSKVPRSIVLIMNHSTRMYTYMKTSVASAKTLVNKLNPADKMAIVTDNVELLTGFTSDKELLKQKLDLLETRNQTKDFGLGYDYSALLATLNELFNEQTKRPIVIFQSDGAERLNLKGVFSEKEFNKLQEIHKRESQRIKVRNSKFKFPAELKTREFSFDDLVTTVEKSGASIYSVIPGLQLIGYDENEQVKRYEIVTKEYQKLNTEIFYLPENSPQNAYSDKVLRFHTKQSVLFHTSLTQLATFTGGWADYLETPEKADEIYSRILNDMNSRYIIGYYPTNDKRDGKRRNIKIEVRNHPEYIVWGRKTYFAPEE